MRAADRLADWVSLVDDRFPERDAEPWDATGLQVGDPEDAVTAVLVCLDVTGATLAEAAGLGADLVIAHHPLLFRPLARLTPDTAAGGLALRAARAGIAVLAAHTNLDVAVPGTSDPVAAVLGLQRLAPLTPLPPGTAASPVPPRGRDKGLGLVGELPGPQPLEAVARALAEGLPAPHLRLGGDPDRLVRRVAVCGGAGDSQIDAARRAGADVLVTGDLRHHVALDARALGLALIDAGHHATEAAALPSFRAELAAGAREHGLSARVLASSIVTDPWFVPGRGDWAADEPGDA